MNLPSMNGTIRGRGWMKAGIACGHDGVSVRENRLDITACHTVQVTSGPLEQVISDQC